MADPAPNWNAAPPEPPPVVPPPPPAPGHIGIGPPGRPPPWSSPPQPTLHNWRRIAVIGGLAILGLLVIGLATGHVRLLSARDQPTRLTPADSLPQVGTAENGVLQGDQLSLRYPKKWLVLREPGLATSGNPTGVTIVGLGTDNEVIVETIALDIPVTQTNFPDFESHMRELAKQHAGTSGDGIVAGPTDTTLGGLPALEFRLSGPGPAGIEVSQRIVVSARGKTEYWINCLSTWDHRAAIARGCDQILRTFRVGEVPTDEGRASMMRFT
jgi:hypothetical protein